MNPVGPVTVEPQERPGNGYIPFLLKPWKRIFPESLSCMKIPDESKTMMQLSSLVNWDTDSRLVDIAGTCKMLLNLNEGV